MNHLGHRTEPLDLYKILRNMFVESDVISTAIGLVCLDS